MKVTAKSPQYVLKCGRVTRYFDEMVLVKDLRCFTVDLTTRPEDGDTEFVS